MKVGDIVKHKYHRSLDGFVVEVVGDFVTIKSSENGTIWTDRQDNFSLAATTNKYHRTVKSTTIDVYDVLVAWDVTNPAVQHAIKKLLQPGARGHKSKKQDLEEALASIKRAIELEAE